MRSKKHLVMGVMGIAASLFGSMGLTGCGSSTPPAAEPTIVQPTATASSATPAAQDSAATRAAALESLTVEEGKSGNCDPDHKAALDTLLGEVEASLKTKTGDDGAPLNLQIVSKRVVALGPNPKSVELSVSGKGTELHVLAFGAKDVSMDVLVGTAAATTMRSPFQHPTASPLSIDLPKVGKLDELQTDSRVVNIKPGAPVVVRLSGQGCTAMISALKP